MSRITSRITKKLTNGDKIIGEINFKELRSSHKSRNRRILKQENPIVCRIFRDEYSYSQKLSDKPAYAFIKTDDNKYLKIVRSRKYLTLPLSAMIFILNNIAVLNTVGAITGITITIGTVMIIGQNVDSPEKETILPEQPTALDNIIIKDYVGDELQEMETTPSNNEDNYTVIDGIIYSGDCLSLDKTTAIPLGNNPENAKTGVSLEFTIIEGNDIIFKSPRLKPGTGVDFIAGNYLNSGIHELCIIIDVYHEDGAKDIGCNQNIKIEISD